MKQPGMNDEEESETPVTSVATRPVSEAKMNRFYDKLRRTIESSLRRGDSKPRKWAEYLLIVPDIFMLLVRLVNDARVSGKNKILLGTGIAYFILPIDLMPELILGPIGYLDDLVLAVYILNRILTDTDEELLREHWSGSGDVLETIQRVLRSADGLVTKDLVGRFKKLIK